MGTSGTCVSAVQALDLAKKYMTLEDYDCAVVVGTDWMTSSDEFIVFLQLLGAIKSTGRSVPWDESRDGFVMGEGSVCVVVESLDKAKAQRSKH